MKVAYLFWPPDRKLFRQRPRLRGLAPSLAVMVLMVLVAAVRQGGWT